MSLKEMLSNDWKQALKDRDKFKANTLSTARAAILQIEKTTGVVLDDAKVIEVLAKEVKKRKEAIQEFESGGRKDAAVQPKAEIEIFMKYLPQQLTEDKIKEYVKKAVIDAGANSMKDMGKVMKIVLPELAGRADGKLISQIVKEYLNK